MRTAVVRVNVDPDNALAPAQLSEGMAVLLGSVGAVGAELIVKDLASLPAGRREVDGFDIVHVTLRERDLERVPESRVHTALEASLNCEVHIRTV